MIRHARAALLAWAVLGAAAPASAADGDWWVLSDEPGSGVILLIDAASSKTLADGVVETRLLTEVSDARGPLGWMDAQAQHDCAHSRVRVTHVTLYGPDRKPARTVDSEAWRPLPAGDETSLFLCKGERDRFRKRDGFTPPVG